MKRANPTPIPPTGLTVLNDPENADIDIVFIHGFTGHPHLTWNHKHGKLMPQKDAPYASSSEPPPKTRRLNLFSNRPSDRDSTRGAVYWPQDLLPRTLPHARVLTYGYDTHVRHRVIGPPQNPQTIKGIARDFLQAVERERTSTSRPLLFIAHSLGGLVVKEMLLLSKNAHKPYLRAVFESTKGLVFFGTPHCGADPRGFVRSCFEVIVKGLGFSISQNIVEALSPTDRSLWELNEEFKQVAERNGWIIHSFQEQYPVQGLGRKVVEETSSLIKSALIETSEDIAQNHMDMCRFPALDDVEYKKVAGILQRMVGSLLAEPPPVSTTTALLTPEERKALHNALDFDQIDSRYNNLKRAHKRTCIWLSKRREYQDWLRDPVKLQEHHGFLWIKGKAGTGKSTLMKFALEEARKKSRKPTIVISFFFHARGSEIEKSTMGMYRSLLKQLLDAAPELESIFDSLSPTTARRGMDIVWTIELLKDLFTEAIRSLGQRQLICFVDALDECSQEEVIDMVTTFEDLGRTALKSQVQFFVCFASRYYPHIDIAHRIELKLEDMDGHTQDIETYIHDRLRIGKSDISSEIKIDLQEKAGGIFMWVALVVDILNDEFNQGGVHRLRERLKDIPKGLDDLFSDLLTRDSARKGQLLVSIQWVLFARRPLRPLELYFAIRSSIESGIPAPSPGIMEDENVRKYILSSSKGLVEIIEIKKAKTLVVQFIHESVRDFLTKRNGIGKVGPEFGPKFEAESHERLKKCCMRYLEIDHISPPRTRATSDLSGATPEPAQGDCPLLEYAAKSVLYHADRAAHSVPQKAFLEDFPLERWIKLYNPFEMNQIRRYHQSASLLYILAEQNLPALVRTQPPTMSMLSTDEKCRYKSTFFAALATGSRDAVMALCEVELALTHSPPSPHLERLCHYYVDFPSEIPELGRTFSHSSGGISLTIQAIACGADKELASYLIREHVANTGGWEAFLEMAMKADNPGALSAAMELHTELFADVSTSKGMKEAARKTYLGSFDMSKYGQEEVAQWDAYDYLLSAAVQRSKHNVAKWLLQRPGIGSKHQHKSGWSLLHEAARAINPESIISTILEATGINPNINYPERGTPLFIAAGKSSTTTMKKLLETNRVDPDALGPGGQTPLCHVASRQAFNAERRLRMLLDTKRVNVNHQDINGRSALSLAVGSPSIYMVYEKVQMLLEYEVDVNLKDNEGLTALDRVRQHKHFKPHLVPIEKLLQEHGALSGEEVPTES